MLEKAAFFENYPIEERFHLSGFSWEELEAIYDDYTDSEEELQDTAKELNRLFSENSIKGKHSVRYRCKNGEHLIEKIIRNATNNTAGSSVAKYKMINRTNYKKLITDLIGIRILVLTKEDWEGVHDFIMARFQNIKERYLQYWEDDYGYVDDPDAMWIVEPPVAYVRYGDSDIFKGKLEPKYTHKDYRSQHYIVKYKNVYCEIQVRTLAEEVYGEFDHSIRYPYHENNRFLKKYTAMLSKITVATDSILSLCKGLPDEMLESCGNYFEEEVYPEFNAVFKHDNPSERANWGTQNILEASNMNLERRIRPNV